MTAVIWPRSALIKPRDIAVDVLARTLVGPPAIAGQQQAVASSAGVWAITYSGITIRGSEGLMLWRALAAQIEGRLSPIILPVFERPRRTPSASTAASVEALVGDVAHGDGAEHGDGAGYAGLSDVAGTTVDAVAAGAVAWRIDVVGPRGLAAGMHFSVGHRLYRVRAIAAAAAGRYTITAWPPARDAVLAGSPVELARLVCRVRLASDAGMDSTAVHGNRHGDVAAVRFIEEVGS